MTAKTNAERQREFRARHEDESRKEVRGVFAHIDDHAAIKEVARKMAARRYRKAAKA